MKVADAQDLDPQETREWLDALSAVRGHRGNDRAEFVVNAVIDAARRDRLQIAQSLTTPYCNTIPPDQQPALPGDRAIEHRLRSIIRWNALAIILRANKESSELGGHIASFQSAATLYDIGFGHFWHAPTDSHGGDLIFVQGHCSPGIYARAFLEGRLSEEQLLGYRQETGGKGLSSYPHPWLMPDFWQFPTVSMGLGPLDGDLSGALPEVPPEPRAGRDIAIARSGPSWATARWTSRNRSARSRSPAAKVSTT